MPIKRATLFGVVLAMIMAGTLYFFTCARDIIVGDSPELITAAVTLGVPHPPGYPLFTVLGHLFSFLPLQPIPFRVNLFSAACDCACVGMVYLTAFRLTKSQLGAATASLLLALNPIFWRWSLTAEVFPLNNLLAATVIYFLLTWYEEPERAGRLMAASFLTGLGLTNHHTMVLLAPAIVFLLWRRRRFLRPRGVAVCAVLFWIGLLPYAYIPWAAARHPACNWGGVSSLHDLIAVVSRSDYGSGTLVGNPSYQGGSPLRRIVALIYSFGWVAGPLLVVGAIETYRNIRWYFWFSTIAFVLAGPFFLFISNVNLDAAPRALSVLERFFLLSHVVVAPSLAFGVLAIVKLVNRYLTVFARSSTQFVAAVVGAVLVVSVATNYRALDQSHNQIARHFGEDAFISVEPGGILLMAGDAIAFPLIYLQTVEHVADKIPLIGTTLLSTPWYLRQLRERYPDVIIPFAEYDGEERNLKMLLDANADRKVFAIGPATSADHSLDQTYLTYPHGVLMLLAPRWRSLSAEDVLTQNRELLNRYRIPPSGTFHADTLEADILTTYAWPAFRIGDGYERSGNTPEARIWYQRALTIDPNLPQAKDSLLRIRN